MKTSLLITVIGILISNPLWALEAGQVLPAFELPDQHGEAHTLDTSIKRIYTSSGRASDKMLKAALADTQQAALDAQNAVVVADISAAPGFVRRIIKSSLKDRPYLTWVDQRGKTQKFLGYREDHIGVIELDAQKVLSVRYLSNTEELKAALTESKSNDTQSPAGEPPASPAPTE